MFMFAEFDVRWFPDQICGLLNAEKGLCCYSVVNAYLETFTARDANVVKTTTDV